MVVLAGLSAFFSCKKVDTSGANRIPVESVELDQSDITLVIGDELVLHATVRPSNASRKDVTWSSDDSGVVSVDASGKITAKKTGSTRITVKTVSGAHTAACKVTVVNETIPVTGVSLTPKEITLRVGGEQWLTVQLEPATATNHKVTWWSGDETVATVNDGQVKGIARGTTEIHVKTEDGGKEASVPVRVVQPFTKVIITSPDISDSHYNADTKKYVYVAGETFQLKAKGEPADADDEIEYAYSGMDKYYEIDPSGKVTTKEKRSDCRVRAWSKAEMSVYGEFTFDIVAAPSEISLTPDAASSAVKIRSGNARNTACIGVGATQVYTVSVTPAGAPQQVSIRSKTGNATFSLAGNKLTVKVPSTASASTLSTENVSKVVLEAAAGYTQEFSFKITKFDPYQVKVGDVITEDGAIGDGGFRGVGIFEAPVYKVSDVNCIIAHLGEEHMTEDPLWNQYKPSKGITALGQAVHGIAIPVNITKLYRKNVTVGEHYYADGNNDNYIEDSGNLPKWVKNYSERLALLRSNSLKHSAFMNTCCHVYCNAGRGESYEIIPYNFFVCDATKKPSQDAGESNSMASGQYSFADAFSSIDNGFNATSYYSENNLLGPWVLPTIADFISVFTEFSPGTSGNFTDIEYNNNNQVKFKVQVLQKTLSVYGSSSLNYNDTPWWLANETGQNKLVQGKIWNDGASFKISKSVPHKSDSWKAYVLPIRYF